MLGLGLEMEAHLALGETPLRDPCRFCECGVVDGSVLTLVVQMRERKDALHDLLNFLEDGEKVTAVVYGHWHGSDEPRPPAVPRHRQGEVLMPYEAGSYMAGWRFERHDWHGPTAYAANIWTDRRAIWMTQYDGSTWLESMPLAPTAMIPSIPGGSY